MSCPIIVSCRCLRLCFTGWLAVDCPIMASPDESAGDGDGSKELAVFHRKKKIKSVHFLLDVKAALRDQSHVYERFIKIMLDIRNQMSANLDSGGRYLLAENCTAKLRELLVGQTRIIKGFKNFTEGLLPFCDEQQSLGDSLSFIRKIKNCPDISKDDYDGFVHTMHRFYNMKTMTADDVFQEVIGFLGHSPELLEEFRSYLPPQLARAPPPHEESGRSPNIGRGDKVKPTNGNSKVSLLGYPQHSSKKGKHGHSEYSFEHEKAEFQHLMYTWNAHKNHGLFQKHLNEGPICSKESPNLEAVMRANCDVNDMIEDEEDGHFLARSPFTDNRLPPKEDLSNCTRCTPSYCVLPENCTTLQSSQQTDLERSVLNSALVSVTSGSEDSYKFRTKNQYEENIYKCEDDMFESDILLQRFRTTAELIMKLQAKADDPGSNMKSELGKHLTPLHRRCIEQLYDVHGLDMLDALSENTSAALTVLAVRLNQMIEGLSSARLSLNKACQDILSNNSYRSLDHRGPSFKQLDIKRMSPKALLDEAKETKKMKWNAGDESLSSVSNSQQPSISDMAFNHTDLHIHDDIRNIVYWASSRSCASEDQSCKIMMIWTAVVEPFLGVDDKPANLKDNIAFKEVTEQCDLSKDISRSICGATLTNRNVPVMNLSTEAQKSSIDDALLANNFLLSPKSGQCHRNKINGCNSSHDRFDMEIEEVEIIPDVENVQMDAMLGPWEGKLKHNEKLAASFDAAAYSGDEMRFHNLATSSSKHGSCTPSESEKGDGFKGNSCSEMDSASYGLRAEEQDYSKQMTTSRDAKGGMPFPSSGCFLPRPFTRCIAESWHDIRQEVYKVFYGSSSFYVIFRLHQVLYERLLLAKVLLKHASNSDLYAEFKKKLCSLLDGSIDNLKFEEYCLLFLGPMSYQLFTLDKLIIRIVKQLCKIASNDKENMILQLYKKSQRRNVPKELLLYQNERGGLRCGRVFKFTYDSSPTRLSIELLERDRQEEEKGSNYSEPKSSDFLYENFLPNDPGKLRQKHFQRRSKRKLENDPVQRGVENSIQR